MLACTCRDLWLRVLHRDHGRRDSDSESATLISAALTRSCNSETPQSSSSSSRSLTHPVASRSLRSENHSLLLDLLLLLIPFTFLRKNIHLSQQDALCYPFHPCRIACGSGPGGECFARKGNVRSQRRRELGPGRIGRDCIDEERGYGSFKWGLECGGRDLESV